MKTSATIFTPVVRSPRVLQLAGMFDVPLADKATLTLHADLPVEDHDWNVGLITGPSGAGKTTIARHLWPGAMAPPPDWPADVALVDGFPAHMGIKDVTGLLSAVGLSSPPAWIRPRHTLSNGEGFRADIARALAGTDGLVVVDEFTSVVDRQVAQVASHTVQKAVRKAGRQFVAVTCHYDVTDWLQPDWIYDAATDAFTWRLVQPHPPVRLAVHGADRAVWRMFSRHHYLSANLNPAAHCFVAYADGRPIAFTSYLHFPHAQAKNIKLAHRIVVLPDWQGLGIAGRISEWLGEKLATEGFRYRISTAHPAFIHYMATSPRWRLNPGTRNLRVASRDPQHRARKLDPRSLTTRSFEYVPTRRTPPASLSGRA